MPLSPEKRKAYMRKYRRGHPEYCERVQLQAREFYKSHDRKWWREYRAKNYVNTTVNGKHRFLRTPYKRPKPSMMECELCGRVTDRLNYHHWDDNDPSVGLWLCFSCHMFVERLEYGEIELYYRLRAEAKKDVDIMRVEAQMVRLREAIGLTTSPV